MTSTICLSGGARNEDKVQKQRCKIQDNIPSPEKRSRTKQRKGIVAGLRRVIMYLVATQNRICSLTTTTAAFVSFDPGIHHDFASFAEGQDAKDKDHTVEKKKKGTSVFADIRCRAPSRFSKKMNFSSPEESAEVGPHLRSVSKANEKIPIQGAHE
ncbi:hypothetical protein BHE74_00003846 [Ensete ventricosum]|nr:hypothetical protein BHE74_00003846 [Ensete ventricosum]